MKTPDLTRIGFRLCQTTSLLLTAAAVVSFFAGNLGFTGWDGVQWFYGVVGLLLSGCLIAFASSAYGSGSRWAMILAACISIGLEVSQTLERTTSTAQQRAEASSLYRTALAGVQQPDTATLTSEQRQLAAAQATLSAIRREAWPGERKAAQVEVNRLTGLVAMQQQAKSLATAEAWERAKTSSRADDHAHAGIRLLMTVTGWSLESASAAFGLALVAALQVAFWWLGQSIALSTANQGSPAPSIESIEMSIASIDSRQAAVISPESGAAPLPASKTERPSLATGPEAANVLAVLQNKGSMMLGNLQASISPRIRPLLADLLCTLADTGKIRLTQQGRGTLVEVNHG